MKSKLFVTATVLSLSSLYVWADAPIQLSLTPDIALQSRSTEINGLSLNIWGENPQRGLTLGFINGSTGESAGFTAGVVNYNETYDGIQWGLVNISQDEFIGWQCAVVNISNGTFEGFQSGVVNLSQKTTDLQLGLVNYTQELNDVQIGLVNIIADNPSFTEFPNKLATGFPIVNWSF